MFKYLLVGLGVQEILDGLIFYAKNHVFITILVLSALIFLIWRLLR